MRHWQREELADELQQGSCPEFMRLAALGRQSSETSQARQQKEKAGLKRASTV
jgi:hypothetical protein